MSRINGRFEELVVSESDSGILLFEIVGKFPQGSPSIDLIFNSEDQVQQAYPLIQSLREIGGFDNLHIYTPSNPPDVQLVGWPNKSSHWPVVYVKKPSDSWAGDTPIRCYSCINGDLGASRQEIESLYRELTKLYKANQEK